MLTLTHYYKYPLKLHGLGVGLKFSAARKHNILWTDNHCRDRLVAQQETTDVCIARPNNQPILKNLLYSSVPFGWHRKNILSGHKSIPLNCMPSEDEPVFHHKNDCRPKYSCSVLEP